MNFLYMAKSGNAAKVQSLAVGDRAVFDIAWSVYPPSDEDVKGLEEFLKKQGTIVERHMFDEKREFDAAVRKWLGGGQG